MRDPSICEELLDSAEEACRAWAEARSLVRAIGGGDSPLRTLERAMDALASAARMPLVPARKHGVANQS